MDHRIELPTEETNPPFAWIDFQILPTDPFSISFTEIVSRMGQRLHIINVDAEMEQKQSINETKTCVICHYDDDLTTSEGVVCSEGHFICSSDFVRYLEEFFTNRKYLSNVVNHHYVTCAMGENCSLGYYGTEKMKPYLIANKSIQEKYQKWLLDHSLMTASILNTDTVELVCPEHPEFQSHTLMRHEITSKVCVWRCEACNGLPYCLSCGQADFSCTSGICSRYPSPNPMLMALRQEIENEQIKLFIRLVFMPYIERIGASLGRCPNYITCSSSPTQRKEKLNGCNELTCPCGTTYCACCGRQFFFHAPTYIQAWGKNPNRVALMAVFDNEFSVLRNIRADDQIFSEYHFTCFEAGEERQHDMLNPTNINGFCPRYFNSYVMNNHYHDLFNSEQQHYLQANELYNLMLRKPIPDPGWTDGNGGLWSQETVLFRVFCARRIKHAFDDFVHKYKGLDFLPTHMTKSFSEQLLEYAPFSDVVGCLKDQPMLRSNDFISAEELSSIMTSFLGIVIPTADETKTLVTVNPSRVNDNEFGLYSSDRPISSQELSQIQSFFAPIYGPNITVDAFFLSIPGLQRMVPRRPGMMNHLSRMVEASFLIIPRPLFLRMVEGSRLIIPRPLQQRRPETRLVRRIQQLQEF